MKEVELWYGANVTWCWVLHKSWLDWVVIDREYFLLFLILYPKLHLVQEEVSGLQSPDLNPIEHLCPNRGHCMFTRERDPPSEL